MKIAARQLEGQLKKGLAALYAVHGAEPLVALEAADRIREAARKSGAAEREVFYAEPGVDWSRLDAYLISYVVEPAQRATAMASSLAVALEMVREGQIEVNQSGAFAPIFLRKRAGDTQAGVPSGA